MIQNAAIGCEPPNTAPLRGIPCGHYVFDVHPVPTSWVGANCLTPGRPLGLS